MLLRDRLYGMSRPASPGDGRTLGRPEGAESPPLADERFHPSSVSHGAIGLSTKRWRASLEKEQRQPRYRLSDPLFAKTRQTPVACDVRFLTPDEREHGINPQAPAHPL